MFCLFFPDFERRAITAAGELQERLGCGVSFHPHREPRAPFEILRLYLEAGGRADKAVMSHLDRKNIYLPYIKMKSHASITAVLLQKYTQQSHT